jgi:hypothetical protein
MVPELKAELRSELRLKTVQNRSPKSDNAFWSKSQKVITQSDNASSATRINRGFQEPLRLYKGDINYKL